MRAGDRKQGIYKAWPNITYIFLRELLSTAIGAHDDYMTTLLFDVMLLLGGIVIYKHY